MPNTPNVLSDADKILNALENNAQKTQSVADAVIENTRRAESQRSKDTSARKKEDAFNKKLQDMARREIIAQKTNEYTFVNRLFKNRKFNLSSIFDAAGSQVRYTSVFNKFNKEAIAANKGSPLNERQSLTVSRQTQAFLAATSGKGFGPLAGAFEMLGKAAGSITPILSAVSALLQILSEKGQFFRAVSSSMGINPLTNYRTQDAYSLKFAGALNQASKFGTFANDPQFKDAIKSVMGTGVLPVATQAVEQESLNIALAFKMVAAQGIALGASFEETAKNFTSIASMYPLGTGAGAVKNFSAVQAVMGRGRQSGFMDSQIMQFATGYNKSGAVSRNFGLAGVLKDLVTIIDDLQKAKKSPESASYRLATTSPQMLTNMLTSVAGSSLGLGGYAALVKGGGTVGAQNLNSLTREYWGTSRLAQLGAAWNTMSRKTGQKEFLAETWLSQIAPGLNNELGTTLLNNVLGNKSVQKTLMSKSYKGLTENEALMKLVSDNRLGLNTQQRTDLLNYAYQQKLLEKPLETIIAILSGLLKSVVQIAASPLFGGNQKATLRNVVENAQKEFKDISGNSNKYRRTV